MARAVFEFAPCPFLVIAMSAQAAPGIILGQPVHVC